MEGSNAVPLPNLINDLCYDSSAAVIINLPIKQSLDLCADLGWRSSLARSANRQYNKYYRDEREREVGGSRDSMIDVGQRGEQ